VKRVPKCSTAEREAEIGADERRTVSNLEKSQAISIVYFAVYSE
jgi:hypothetical protein